MTIVFCLLPAAGGDARAQTEPVPDLVTAERIQQEEFEPAVKEQLSRIHEEARNKPKDAAAVGKLGMMFHVYGKYELAENCYIRAHSLSPRAFRWLYYLALAEKAFGKNDRAMVHFREALGIDPGYAPARIALAALLLDSGDADQSAEICRSVIAQNGKLAMAHFALGQALAARSDWAGAIDAYRRACDAKTNYAAAHYALGMAYRNTGDMGKAREHLELYRKVKDLKQLSEDPLMDEVHALYSGGLTRFAKGSVLFMQGKGSEAIPEFEAALEVNPRLVRAHINLIALYGQLNQTEKAGRHFQAAVDLDQGWVESYYNWGLVLSQHGRKSEASALFQKALEINPQYPDAHVQFGIVLDDLGQHKDATAHYRRALEVNPEHRQAHYFLGRDLLREGQVKEAVEHLLETTKVEDGFTPICMQAVAIAYERAGNRERAVHFLREAQRRAAALRLQDMQSQLQRDIDRLEVRRP